jgi:hypothetical protein
LRWFFLFSILFMCWIPFIDLHMLNHICTPRMKPTVMVYNLFNVLLNLVYKYFIKNGCINVHQGNWSIFHFINFYPDLYYFFLSINFRLACSGLSKTLRYIIRLFIWHLSDF